MEAVLLLFAMKFSEHGPENINSVYGYRTEMSMKNKDTWEFAHKYCALVWRKVGTIMLILSIIVSIVALTLNDNIQGIACVILLTIQALVLILSIFPVEKALKENFDENGNRKSK